MFFFKPKYRFRVLYHNEKTKKLDVSVPMSRQTAEDYFSIFDEAYMLVEVKKRKRHAKPRSNTATKSP